MRFVFGHIFDPCQGLPARMHHDCRGYQPGYFFKDAHLSRNRACAGEDALRSVQADGYNAICREVSQEIEFPLTTNPR